MPSRVKSGGETTPPPPTSVPPPLHTAGAADHSFSLQYMVQTERSIGELKIGLENLTKSSEKHAASIESLNETVHTAKWFLKALTIIGSIIGAVGLALLGTITKILADHFGK